MNEAAILTVSVVCLLMGDGFCQSSRLLAGGVSVLRLVLV
jgi:hypothetical protein